MCSVQYSCVCMSCYTGSIDWFSIIHIYSSWMSATYVTSAITVVHFTSLQKCQFNYELLYMERLEGLYFAKCIGLVKRPQSFTYEWSPNSCLVCLTSHFVNATLTGPALISMPWSPKGGNLAEPLRKRIFWSIVDWYVYCGYRLTWDSS